MKLFKYERINDKTKENLSKSQIYFNAPINFNDPYEGMFKFHATGNTVKRELIKFLYKHEYDPDYFDGNSIDDLIEIARFEYVKEYLNDMRIACFSRINDSMLMWSHYSNQHTGICLEFDSDDIFFGIGEDVSYSSDMPKICISNEKEINEMKLIELYNDVAHSKAEDWKYEKEYRLFDYKSENIKRYHPDNLKAIYFGLRCSDENIEEIMKLISNKNVKYYRCDLDKEKYNFSFINLDRSKSI